MSGSTQAEADNGTNPTDNTTADSNSNSNSSAPQSGNSDHDVSSAMSQSVQEKTVGIDEVKATITDELIIPLNEAQEEAREDYGPDTVVNANITASEGEVNVEIQDVEDGVPDEAIHIAGVLNMPDMDIRQFTDPTIFASSSYDARDVLKTGGDEEALFSSSWVADSEWHVIPNPNHDDNPTVEEALGALVETVLNEGHPINVSVDSAEDLLRAE